MFWKIAAVGAALAAGYYYLKHRHVQAAQPAAVPAVTKAPPASSGAVQTLKGMGYPIPDLSSIASSLGMPSTTPLGLSGNSAAISGYGSNLEKIPVNKWAEAGTADGTKDGYEHGSIDATWMPKPQPNRDPLTDMLNAPATDPERYALAQYWKMHTAEREAYRNAYIKAYQDSYMEAWSGLRGKGWT